MNTEAVEQAVEKRRLSYALRVLKGTATKLAKRVTKVCKLCGKVWKEKPSHAWRVYCSYACGGKARRTRMEYPCPRCGTMKFRYKSAPNKFCKKCISLNQSEYQAKNSINPYVYETAESKKKRLGYMASDENKNRISKLFKGKHPQNPLNKRYGSTHCAAKECFMRDPRNVIHYVCNMSGFIHNNPNLFNPEDLVQKLVSGKKTTSNTCNATQGLSQISRGHRMSWKGWTLVSNREGRERFDLLGRNWKDDHSSRDLPTATGAG